MPDFSFIILSYNEELHLPRLLASIKPLGADIFVLDSGSTDRTLQICEEYGVIVAFNKFENHPKQWHSALSSFPVTTPWVIGLDSDQIVTEELQSLLKKFKDADYTNFNGIYFNRKNFFRGKWLKHGGYYPKYLLKMFRTGVGYSDLNENMDHRFVVPGNTTIWRNGHILEENLKENEISFWIAKHNHYSDLVAQEEIERRHHLRIQTIRPAILGNPDQRVAFMKSFWWKLPLGLRPFLYFFYRMIFQLGILDGKTGILFHFLQGFWFRLIVDVKIKEFKRNNHFKI
nr:glycosyltransferase family 2 protein [Pedobacter xinjiangensis]